MSSDTIHPMRETLLVPLPAKICLLGLTAEEMRRSDLLGQYPAFRSRQVHRWIYGRGVSRFQDMTDLPTDLRTTLDEQYSLELDQVETITPGRDREAYKFLFRLDDGRLIESVLINAGARRTICVSSQAGCAYGCTFCATATMGPGRNLTRREIVSQVLGVRQHMRREGFGESHNIVFMGMGEPLANLENLIPSLELLQADEGLGVGNRRITVSTVGLPPKIRELCDAPIKVRLAFSLNATTDEVRDELMPVNRRYPFREVFEELKHFQNQKRVRVSLEYVLLADVNDSDEDARRLGEFSRELNCRVNAIVYNAHPASPYQPSAPLRISAFVETLSRIAPRVTVRYSKGQDILAACGQLSTKWLERGPGGVSAP